MSFDVSFQNRILEFCFLCCKRLGRGAGLESDCHDSIKDISHLYHYTKLIWKGSQIISSVFKFFSISFSTSDENYLNLWIGNWKRKAVWVNSWRLHINDKWNDKCIAISHTIVVYSYGVHNLLTKPYHKFHNVRTDNFGWHYWNMYANIHAVL